MSQISPPIRILLLVAIAFMGVYMLFMRPKDEAIPPANPAPNTQTSEPAVSEPGKVAEAAQGAVDAANSQLQQQESVDGVDTGEAAAAAAGVDLNGIPKPIAKAIRKDKTLVLLFWNGKSADDKAVHKALADVNRWDGRVYVGSASIKKISKFGRISRGVDVEQSPTVVIADNQLHAETLVGYVDAKTIDQAVVDAFRNTTGIFTDPYLKQVDKVCFHYSNQVAAIPTGFSNAESAHEVQKDLDARLIRFDRKVRSFTADFKAIKAPKRWAGLKRNSLADLNVISDAASQASSSITTHSNAEAMLAAGRSYGQATNASSKQLNERFDEQNLFRCGSQF